jgi:hypothetical protein
MKYALIFLILISTATATHDFYYYNNENDLRYNVAAALYNPFDHYDLEDAADFDKYECISLDDYNYYAELDAYDGMDTLTAKNIDSETFDKLRYEDQLAIINEKPGDKWDRNDINGKNDMECWTLKDYNKYSSQDQYDEWDEVYFHDFDDLETINEIGIRRYGFIEPDDLATFNLHYTAPHYSDYDEYYWD